MTKPNIEHLKTNNLSVNDSFYLITEKPKTFSTKIINTLFKMSKPFSLGVGAYLSFELLKKLGLNASNSISSISHYIFSLFNTSIDSIKLYLLSFYELINPQYSATQFLSLISYIVAIGFMINSLRRYKDHNDTKGEIPISEATLLAAVSGLLFILPTLLHMSKG